MKIAVIDAKGGGLGKSIVHKIRSCYDKKFYIIALGTNEAGCKNMKVSNPDFCDFGEEAIMYWCKKADIIIGPIGIIIPNAILGEITPNIANAVTGSSAKKIVLPINKCNVFVPNTLECKMTEMIDAAVKMLADI